MHKPSIAAHEVGDIISTSVYRVDSVDSSGVMPLDYYFQLVIPLLMLMILLATIFVGIRFSKKK
jgi:hypothetical protein